MPRIHRRFTVWLIPLAYAATGLVAGVWTQRISTGFLPEFVSLMSVSAAMSFYSAVASGMIALTGIVFSLMFVMVQFSATVYSPRLVFWVSRDPVTSHALGVFTATFLYALAALVWVDRGGSGRVPMLGVIIVTALLVASICMFISLTQRVGVLQVNRMLIFTADRAREVIDRTFPPLDTPPAPGWVGRTATGSVLHSGRPMVVQQVDTPTLIGLATGSSSVIELTVAPGDTVLESTPIALVHGGDAAAVEAGIRRSIVLGTQRTFDQDPQYGIRLLVDIAIRALSPAINDPTTAVQALDQIGDLLIRLGRRRLESGVFRDPTGNVRLVMPVPSWEELLRLALDEIRACGAGSVQVMRRMNALVTDLIAVAPEERRPALVVWRTRLHATAERTFADTVDRVEALADDRQGLGGLHAPTGR